MRLGLSRTSIVAYLGEGLYADVLVLDEAVYVSRRKHGVPVAGTLGLVDRAVLPYVDVLPLTLREHVKARGYMVKYNLKPSDALHLAVMNANGIHVIATEDEDFDRVPVRGIWIE